MAEVFRPIAVRPPQESRTLFLCRCLVDLQLLTIYRFLRGHLTTCKGRVLDVGAGEAPWRELLSEAEYVGVDVEVAGEFGMRHKADITYYDGNTLPFADASFDHVLCTEVLEHVPEPRRFLVELHRVLRRGGSLVLTVPWSARLHHVPHDYTRFTRFGLNLVLESAGFTGVVTVCLPFNALTNPVPFLFHFEAVPSPPAPFPVPSFPPWINRTASVNTVDHVVCGVVSSLSPFAVLMPADVAGQLQVLHALVESFNLRKPVARRFIHRLGEVREAWVSKHRHHHRTHEFCRELEKFMRDVEKASGRTLTAAEADQLLALAHVIAGDAGCGS